VAEHRLAGGAFHVLGEAQRGAGFLQCLRQQPAPTAQLDAAQVLRLVSQEVEGVEAGARLAVTRHELVEVGQAVEAMRYGLAVKHETLERECLHGLGDGDELGQPVAAVAGP
jgi:hypothetical protein